MELEIYGEVNKRKVVKLRLVQDHDEIRVIACDEYGDKVNRGHLIAFRMDGTIYRYHGVSEKLGFQLDNVRDSRIIIDKSEG